MDSLSGFVVRAAFPEELGNLVVNCPVHWPVVVYWREESCNSMDRSYLKVLARSKLGIEERP
jgi:hypothetical protein